MKLRLVVSFICLALFSNVYAESVSLSLMSYNIQQMGYPAAITLHFEKERLAKLPERILEMPELPDVIVFQEAFLPSAWRFLVAELGEHYPYSTEIGGEDCSSENWTVPALNCKENLRKNLTHNSGVFILSRWPIHDQRSLTFKSYRVSYTFDFMARKGAVYALIEKQGMRFHVLGTHLQADGASHDIRMAQMEEVMDWLSTLSIPEEDVLLFAGDFNISSLEQEKLADLKHKTISELTLAEGEPQSVSPSTNVYLDLIYGGQEEKTLDYVLISKQHRQPVNSPVLEVLDFKASAPWEGKTLWKSSYIIQDISDHYPVLLNMQFE